MYIAQVADRPLDPVVAQLIEVGQEGDGNDLFARALEILEPQIRAAGIDHAPVRQRRRRHVEKFLMRFLLEIAALPIHGPDVHDPVAVGEEINPPIPHHGIVRGSGPIGGQRCGLAAGPICPKAFGAAALVALRAARLLAPGDGCFHEIGTHGRQRLVGKQQWIIVIQPLPKRHPARRTKRDVAIPRRPHAHEPGTATG